MIPKNFQEIIPGYEKNCLYENGFPFTWELVLNLEDLKKRTYDNPRHLPSMIVFDGVSGYGKTSGAALVASYLQGSKIDLHKQIGQGAKNFSERVEWCIANNKRVVIYDEAGDFSRKATMTRANAAINRVFDTYRTFAIIVIVCMPDITKLDNEPFDKSIPRLLINLCEAHGTYTSFRAYSLKGMLWIRHNWKKFNNPIKEYAYTRVIPNFRGHIKKLPDALQAEIDAISSAGKVKEINKSFKKISEV